ncbi:anti-sigma factor family protein [Streptomyces sp. NPDC057900]|uniref:anti-sigma factor family protein n=1 Tax=Streptomyces sp. NPDC057900 TaxID=3346274 RepID=UPI0036F04400
MTSTTDTPQHPDVSEISDLTEGVLSPPRTADVRRHVDGCELCSDVQASLEEIRSLLGSIPAPQTMPIDIADRIDAALADEARAVATASDTEAEGSHAQADVSRDTEAHVSRETESAAIGQELADRPAGHARAATGPGRGPVRRRRRRAVFGTTLGAAVVGVSVFLLQNVPTSHNSADVSASDHGASAKKSDSQAFSQSTVQERVHSLLSSGTEPSDPEKSAGQNQAPSIDTKSSPETEPPGSASPQAPLRAPVVTVPSCVEQGIGRNAAVLAVEKGTYQGADAFLVVLPHPTDTTRVEAYVVDAACVGADPAVKGKLLLTHAYARP